MSESVQENRALTGAERARRHRLRCKKGLRVVRFSVRDKEVAALVRAGYLPAADQDDRGAIGNAVARLFDRLMQRGGFPPAP